MYDLGPLGLFGCMKWKKGSQLNQYIMAALVTFPALAIGMVLGWVSPALPQLQDPSGPLGKPISDYHQSWVASVTFLTAFPSMLVGGWVADNIGRKYTVLIASLSFSLCWLIKAVWIQSETIIVGRAVSGIGNAISFVVVPIYVKEISDDNIRGALVSCLILAQNMGFVIMYIIGDLLSFKAVLWISFLMPTVHFVIFLNAPETPSYLVKKGRLEDAKAVLAWLRSVEVTDKSVVEEINELSADDTINSETNLRLTFKILLSDKMALRCFGICCIVIILQECSGYLILLTYAAEVFASAEVGSRLSPNEQAVLLGTVQLLGSVLACCLVERTGRKLLLIMMSFLTGLGMGVLGTCFFVSVMGWSAPGWVPVAAMCLAVFSTAAGFQPTPYVLLAEMFAFNLRGIVNSLCVSLTTIGDFAQTVAFQPMEAAIGAHGTFWSFAAICFLCTAFTFFFVPETKNKSVDEIYTGMRRKNVEKEDIQMSTRC